MNMFFETKDHKFVNLREVTSIAFEEYTDRFGVEKYKVIFNMNYGVSLKNDTSKMIADYVYSIYNTREDFTDAFLYLINLVDEYQWIKCKEPRIVNPDHISFVTVDKHRNRIILNLSCSVSFHGDHASKTSDFVYINCSDKDEYYERLTNIRESLENLIL